MNKNIGIIAVVAALIIGGALYVVLSQKTGPVNTNAPAPTGALNTIQNTQPSGIGAPADAAHTQPASGNEATAEPEVHTVTIQNFSFIPAQLHIKKGDTVMWINRDSVPHRIAGAGFNSEVLQNGQDFSFAFAAAGSFDYICSIHPSMKGNIVVE